MTFHVLKIRRGGLASKLRRVAVVDAPKIMTAYRLFTALAHSGQ